MASQEMTTPVFIDMSDEAQIIAILELASKRRETIIMQCAQPETGQPFKTTAQYCTAAASYELDMTAAEAAQHAKNLRMLSRHPAGSKLTLAVS